MHDIFSTNAIVGMYFFHFVILAYFAFLAARLNANFCVNLKNIPDKHWKIMVYFYTSLNLNWIYMDLN